MLDKQKQILRPVRCLKNFSEIRDLKNCKRQRHETYTDDNHLIKNAFKCFHFSDRHFQSSPEGLKQIKLFERLILLGFFGQF